jgi:FMN phosphatase YigB (HAD superfamily)
MAPDLRSSRAVVFDAHGTLFDVASGVSSPAPASDAAARH